MRDFIKRNNGFIWLIIIVFLLIAFHKIQTGKSWEDTILDSWEYKQKLLEVCPLCM